MGRALISITISQHRYTEPQPSAETGLNNPFGNEPVPAAARDRQGGTKVSRLIGIYKWPWVLEEGEMLWGSRGQGH